MCGVSRLTVRRGRPVSSARPTHAQPSRPSLAARWPRLVAPQSPSPAPTLDRRRLSCRPRTVMLGTLSLRCVCVCVCVVCPSLPVLPGRCVGVPCTQHGAKRHGVRRRYGALCIVTTAHVNMMCVSTEGRGVGLNWRVLVAGQRSDWSPPGQSTDYAAPVIESVVPASGGLLDTAGGDEVVISGANFGPPPQSDDASQRLTVTYGSSSTDRYVYGVGAVLCCVFVACGDTANPP